MQVDLCRHIKTNGLQCRAVALSTSVFCYFHRRLYDSHAVYRHTTVARPDLMRKGAIFDLPTLEDRESVQLAISKVVNALACNSIDLEHARGLLFGLKLAAYNARGLEPITQPTEVVREVFHSPDPLDCTGSGIAAPGLTCEVHAPVPRQHTASALALIPDDFIPEDPSPLNDLAPLMTGMPPGAAASLESGPGLVVRAAAAPPAFALAPRPPYNQQNPRAAAAAPHP